MTTQHAGLIGTGLLGSAITERLINAGYSVWGHDVDAHAMHRFAELGGQPVARLTDVAVAADRIFLSLPDSETVRNVMVKIIPHLQPNSVVIDTTTGTPKVSRQLAERLARVQIEFLDACVLGSSEVTRSGDAVLLVGATDDGFDLNRTLLQAVATQIYHVGGAGSGQEMKLVANLVLGLNRAALAEGLHFAGTFGLDLNTVLEVLKSGAAYSRAMDAKGQKMIEREFAPQARLRQHLKDVNLMLEHAENADTQLPLSELHQILLTKVNDDGDGDLDNSAIIKAW